MAKLNKLDSQYFQTKFTSNESTTLQDDLSIKSPFRFPGSKAQAIKFLKPFWEKIAHDEFREPLVGGGAMFFAKPKVKYVWLNDIDSDLITTYKIIQDPQLRKKLIPKLIVEKANKKRHTEIKEFVSKNEIETAFRYFYLNRTSYSGIMKKPAWGYHEKRSVHPDKWGLRIEESGQKLNGVKITNLDYEEVINAQPQEKSVFLFVDPPYYETDQKRAYEYYFIEEEHFRLCEILKKTNHKFCLTYDDCFPVRDLYDWAEIHEVSWRYHTANSNKAERKMGNELIITNF